MPKKVATKEAKAVKERFFRSFEELRYRGLVRTQKEFCEVVGLSSASNFIRIGDVTSNSEPTITNIILLCEKYGISSQWILLGNGDILGKN